MQFVKTAVIVLFFIMSQSGMSSLIAPPADTVMLLSPPRCRSTALERSFDSRGDMFIAHEPFIYYDSGVEHLDPINPVIAAIKKSSSKNQLWNRIMKLSIPQNQSLFIKEDPRSVGNLIVENNLHKSSSMRFIFLVRHPREILQSLYRKTGKVSPELIDYQKMLEIAHLVRDEKGRIVLVEANDLLGEKADLRLRRLVRQLRLSVKDKLTEWSEGMDPKWNNSIWHQEVAGSRGFYSEAKSYDNLPHDVTEKIEEAVRQLEEPYESLRALAAQE